MSIKIGNNTKRAVFYGGEKNLTRDEDLAIQVGRDFGSTFIDQFFVAVPTTSLAVYIDRFAMHRLLDRKDRYMPICKN